MGALFTVDLEDWNHALHEENQGRKATMEYYFILDLLEKYSVKAVFYVLGRFEKENLHTNLVEYHGHIKKSHGYWHDWGELADRSPYWSVDKMPWPPSGGFFFRVMPLWYLKWAIKKSGVFWIHPHDLMENHPKLRNPFLNWKRRVGLKTARAKLDRLLSEVVWDEPSKN